MISDYVKKVQPFHVDDRGEMFFLSDKEHPFQITEVLLMDTKNGSIRANHYHKKDIHIIYLVNGKVEYITRDMRNPEAKVERMIVNGGEIMISPPMIAHKVVFLEDSLAVVLTTEPRDQKNYEEDTVRLEVEDTK